MTEHANTGQDFLIRRQVQATDLRDAIHAHYAAAEPACMRDLMQLLELSDSDRQRISEHAHELVRRVRSGEEADNAMDAFMAEYDLSSEEGVVLMCLAEALLRIPDSDTAEALISDKLSDANWESHLGRSSSLFVNASTWGLMLTGRMLKAPDSARRNVGNYLKRMASKTGEPMVRIAIRQAMRIMGHQFVMGRTIEEALKRSARKENQRFRYSFDMLGEAALTEADAERYLEAYREAIRHLARAQKSDIYSVVSISVKLSALHPRYGFQHREQVMTELTPRLLELAQMAKAAGIALTMDAEEADRLMLSLDIFAEVAGHRSLEGWNGLGLALQAYQKRAPHVIDWLTELAERSGRRLQVRLVKGAYWDTEIKHAQVEGFSSYPVFTRKANTDVSYLACARKLLGNQRAFYPQFATHNAHTIAAIRHMAGDRLDYEFQRLHGMGESLYREVLADAGDHLPCRVYAPVGSHEDLLPYLVRRLLENGANTSFVNRIGDESLTPEEVAPDPISQVEDYDEVRHPRIALPAEIYGDDRENSAGYNLANEAIQSQLKTSLETAGTCDEAPVMLAAGDETSGDWQAVHNPATGEVIGRVAEATKSQVERAVETAARFAGRWDEVAVDERAAMLERAADTMQADMPAFMRMAVTEAGKTLPDAIAEVREAIDFLRYYAIQARRQFGEATVLPGPTGEHNELQLHGRGPFVCISPWNFPLAIFVGQVAAALVAGNPVLAKPAEQTPLIAAAAVRLLHDAGVPREALQLLPGGGRVGSELTRDVRIAGVAFTGSTDTARAINRALAERDGPIAVLIAETGGQNAMIVDSSALPEQVVRDTVTSAFLSAGQRCSAMRLLYLQDDIADHVLRMLGGAMDTLVVGDPRWLRTDLGPVIDSTALQRLQDHANIMDRQADRLAQTPLPQDLPAAGHFFAPRAYAISSADELEGEVFGPVLHVVRYRARELDRVIEEINGTGFGLTLGVHSRIERTQQKIAEAVDVGNCYINRNMTGAVVGVQPFGGEGLSGTGPKAGGPNYLLRFATERTLTINTAAVGGNASLLAIEH